MFGFHMESEMNNKRRRTNRSRAKFNPSRWMVNDLKIRRTVIIAPPSTGLMHCLCMMSRHMALYSDRKWN